MADTLLTALTVVFVVCALSFFYFFFQAARFANRHRDRLPGMGEKTTWWLRLFAKNGYGEDLDGERRRLAALWLTSGVLTFAIAATVFLSSAPSATN